MDVNSHPDGELLRRFREAGDRAALALLVERHRGLAYRVALSVLRNRADAEDAVQEAFVRLLAHVDRIRTEGSVASLVARTALRAAQNLARSAGRRHARENADVSRESFVPAGLLEQVIEGEDQQAVWNAVDALPDRYRIPVVLYYYEGLSTREIAEVVKISQTAVTTRLSRAVARLRDHFAREGMLLGVTAIAGLLRLHRVDATPASLAARLEGLAGSAPSIRHAATSVPRAGPTVAAKTALAVACLVVVLTAARVHRPRGPLAPPQRPGNGGAQSPAASPTTSQRAGAGLGRRAQPAGEARRVSSKAARGVVAPPHHPKPQEAAPSIAGALHRRGRGRERLAPARASASAVQTGASSHREEVPGVSMHPMRSASPELPAASPAPLERKRTTGTFPMSRASVEGSQAEGRLAASSLPGDVTSPLAPQRSPGHQEGRPDLHTAVGPIVFACPKGQAVKVKGEDSVILTFRVDPVCLKKSDLENQIMSFQTGTQVIVAYVTRPGSREGLLRSVAVEPAKPAK